MWISQPEAKKYAGSRMPAYPGGGKAGWMQSESVSDGYAELVTLHRGAVRAYVVDLTRNRNTAEDVVQETFLRAWRNWERLTGGEGSVRGWLFTVAHNIAVDLARGRRTYAVDDGSWDRLQRPVPDHADAVVANAVLRPALRRLTAEHRAVIFELYYRRSSVAEAARTIGIPPGTVKSRAYNAVRALRHQLAVAA